MNDKAALVWALFLETAMLKEQAFWIEHRDNSWRGKKQQYAAYLRRHERQEARLMELREERA